MASQQSNELLKELSRIDAEIQRLRRQFNSLAREDRILPGYGENADDLRQLHRLAEESRMALWTHQCVNLIL